MKPAAFDYIAPETLEAIGQFMKERDLKGIVGVVVGHLKEQVQVHVKNTYSDKNCLCGYTCEFVPLCRSCHSKVTGKYVKQYWMDTKRKWQL